MTPRATCPACGGSDLRPVGRGTWACRRCRSVTCGPQPAAAPADYGAAYFEDWYERFAEVRSAYLDRLVRDLGHGRGAIAIDVGSGSGLGLAALSRAGWRAVGCERSIAGVRATAAARGLPAVVSDAAALPVRRSRVEAALILDVLAHVTDPAAALRDLSAALASGATVIVKTPYRPAWVYRVAAHLPRRLAWSLLHLPAQRHAFSRSGLAQLLDRCGFEVIEVRPAQEALTGRAVLGSLRGFGAPDRGRVRETAAFLAGRSLTLLCGSLSTIARAKAKPKKDRVG